MTSTSIASGRVTFSLGRDESARCLEQAVRARARVELQSRLEPPEEPIIGRMVENACDSLVVHVESPARVGDLRTVYCDGALLLGGQRYLFCTNVIEVRNEPGRTRLEVAAPTVLHVPQRRRFVRARLAESGLVTLGEPGEFDRPRCEGEMLNLSQSGLACRVDQVHADGWGVGQKVSVVFRPGDSEDPLMLDAIVRTKTPGGTVRTMIVGLEFMSDPSSQQHMEVLRGILEPYI